MAKIESIQPVKTPGNFVYSDIDFAALGEIVRRVSGLSLDAYARRYIFTPLGMRDTMFTPPPALLDRIAPADIENGVLRWGSVQDPMAFHMGEVAGHAGLFGTADDLAKFAEMLLAGGSAQGHRILSPGSIAAMTRPQSPIGQAAIRGYGWDIDFGLCHGLRAGLLAAVLRPYRLYRHGNLDRSGEPELHDRAHQPPASRCHRRDPDAVSPHRRHRRRRRGGQPQGAHGHRRAGGAGFSQPARTAGRAHHQYRRARTVPDGGPSMSCVPRWAPACACSSAPSTA